MADQKRRLAAILSADVVGYFRLMGDDEEATIEVLVNFRDVFSKRIENFDGRVVDTAGDSVLSVFDSVVEAVRCAMEIQLALS
jgi:class 3 adenylate cyclase